LFEITAVVNHSQWFAASNAKKIVRHQVPARGSGVVVWHATHGLVPGTGVVTGVCANWQIEKTTLRIQAA
jgi:primosomal replication protein N